MAKFKKSFMWLMHLNIEGGLLIKKNDLEIILENSNIPIVCLNEHWLKSENINVLNSIPNYSIAHSYCREEGSHGGSCILIKDNLEYIVRDDLCILNEKSVFESSCIEILTLQIIVISIYRTPYVTNFKSFLNKLEKLFIMLNKTTKIRKVYIAGDFNIDLLEDCSHPKHKLDFISLLNQYGFKINFTSPTRITQHTESCIDNILTHRINSPYSVQTMNLELGLSDHRALFINILDDSINDEKNRTNKKSKKRMFSTKNITSFVSKIRETKWDVSVENCFEENCKNFFGLFYNTFEESFPLKFYNDKNKNKKKPWVTKGIRISSRNKRELSQLAKKSNDILFKNYVKKYKTIFNKVCNESKRMCNAKFIKESENVSKAAWCVVKSELGHKKVKNSFPDIKVSNETISDAKARTTRADKTPPSVRSID
jgi:hypothetical protein